jgi:hypothetical protein
LIDGIPSSVNGIACAIGLALFAVGCDQAPDTTVVIDNKYTPSPTNARVIYRGYWQAVLFPNAVTPGSSSDPQSTFPASANTAYAVLAPGWDPESSSPPSSFLVLQSRSEFEVHLNDTLHIPVDDTTFMGDCASGSLLTQAQADFITQLVFAEDFADLRYEAASCTTTTTGDAGAP